MNDFLGAGGCWTMFLDYPTFEIRTQDDWLSKRGRFLRAMPFPHLRWLTDGVVELLDVDVALRVLALLVLAQPLDLDLLGSSVDVLVGLAQEEAFLVVADGQIFGPG